MDSKYNYCLNCEDETSCECKKLTVEDKTDEPINSNTVRTVLKCDTKNKKCEKTTVTDYGSIDKIGYFDEKYEEVDSKTTGTEMVEQSNAKLIKFVDFSKKMFEEGLIQQKYMFEDGLKQQNTELQRQIDLLKQNANDNHKKILEQIEKSINENKPQLLKQLIKQLEQSIKTNLNEKMNELEEKINDNGFHNLKEELEELFKTQDFKQLSKKIDELSEKINNEELIQKINELGAKINDERVLKELETLKQSINSKLGNINEITSKINDLEISINNKYGEQILSKLEKLSEIDSLKESVDLIKGQIDSSDEKFKTHVDNLYQEHFGNRDLQHQIIKGQKQIDENLNKLNKLVFDGGFRYHLKQ